MLNMMEGFIPNMLIKDEFAEHFDCFGSAIMSGLPWKWNYPCKQNLNQFYLYILSMNIRSLSKNMVSS